MKDGDAFLLRGSPEISANHPDLALQNMAGMRNRIAHGYFDLNFHTVWRTVSADVPELLKRLKSIYFEAGETVSGRTTGKTNSD